MFIRRACLRSRRQLCFLWTGPRNSPLKKGRTPKVGVAQYYSVARACEAGVSFADHGRNRA